MELNIFIDESGDLGKFGLHYFIIAALCTTKPKAIYNTVKRIRQRKLKKKLRELSELKANNSDNLIRKAMLDGLMKCECEFHIIAVDKKQVRDYLFEHKNKLYNYVAGILIEHLQGGYKKINIIIDKKDKKSVVREDFNNYIKTHKVKWGTSINIEHLESQQNRGLQAVDFVAWSAHRKYNTEDDSFYKIIKPKIKSIKELFKKEE